MPFILAFGLFFIYCRFEKWYRISPTYNHPLHDDPVDGDLSSLPLTVWASNHEADLNVILDLCTSSLQCTNHSRLTFDTADSDISTLPLVSSPNYIPVASLPPVGP
ncbi:unnamed protein product [Rhizophagus irregularis]|nr:unnamed protein product [Rhizophagus irregularis]